MPLDSDDIARLYGSHARRLVAFFARRTFDPVAAGELMAETFAAAVADRRTFRGEGDAAAAAWLYGIARHQLSGWYRRAAVERKMLRKLCLEPPSLTDAEYERIEELAGLAALRERLAEAIQQLPDESRDALRLRVVEERPYPEVAATLGIAEPAARARVSRALRSLAEDLEDVTEAARGR
jgi:RNA polymerase sigma factor (sigma-70 family)